MDEVDWCVDRVGRATQDDRTMGEVKPLIGPTWTSEISRLMSRRHHAKPIALKWGKQGSFARSYPLSRQFATGIADTAAGVQTADFILAIRHLYATLRQC